MQTCFKEDRHAVQLTEAPSMIALTVPKPCGRYGPRSLQSSSSILGEMTTASSCTRGCVHLTNVDTGSMAWCLPPAIPWLWSESLCDYRCPSWTFVTLHPSRCVQGICICMSQLENTTKHAFKVIVRSERTSVLTWHRRTGSFSRMGARRCIAPKSARGHCWPNKPCEDLLIECADTHLKRFGKLRGARCLSKDGCSVLLWIGSKRDGEANKPYEEQSTLWVIHE